MAAEQEPKSLLELGEELKTLLTRAGVADVAAVTVEPKPFPLAGYLDAVVLCVKISDRVPSVELQHSTSLKAYRIVQSATPTGFLQVRDEKTKHVVGLMLENRTELEGALANLTQQLSGIGTGSGRKLS